TAFTGESRKVELQRIGLVQHETGRARKFHSQQAGQVAIDLDRIERPGPGKQVPGEGTPSGTDLDQPVLRLRIDCVCDPRDDGRVMEEVLTEPFATRRLHATRVTI